MGSPHRRRLIDPAKDRLSVRQTCSLLWLARWGVYRTPAPADADELALTRLIDKLRTGLGRSSGSRLAGSGGDAAAGRARWSAASGYTG
jgi:putative transposase